MNLSSNLLRRRSLQRHWQRYQAKRHILRSQLGFDQADATRPETCIGCRYYHGIAYGQGSDTSGRQRTILICAFYPYGWQGQGNCPDWQSENEPL